MAAAVTLPADDCRCTVVWAATTWGDGVHRDPREMLRKQPPHISSHGRQLTPGSLYLTMPGWRSPQKIENRFQFRTIFDNTQFIRVNVTPNVHFRANADQFV